MERQRVHFVLHKDVQVHQLIADTKVVAFAQLQQALSFADCLTHHTAGDQHVEVCIAHALALHKQFDSYEETQMLLPLAVLYYKLNQFDKAEDCIKRLAKANKDTKKFLRAAARDQLDDYIGEMSPYGYRPFTMEELLDELMHTSYLFNSVPYFFAWASKVLAAKTSAKMSAGKPKLLH